VHDHPPGEELEPFIESRQIPANIEDLLDSPEERALRAAFLARTYLDLITAEWPWVP
jgi:hypothetical protein